MTIINRSSKTIYNTFMMEGIKEAMEELGITAILTARKGSRTDTRTYNLAGHEVKPPHHGIVIKNGKKYIAR